MQISDRSLPITNSTLNILIAELGTECAQVQALINQLQLPSLTANQKAEILAELLAAAVHLHTHCDEDFQTLIANEMESFALKNVLYHFCIIIIRSPKPL